jgi:hypothetical protein
MENMSEIPEHVKQLAQGAVSGVPLATEKSRDPNAAILWDDRNSITYRDVTQQSPDIATSAIDWNKVADCLSPTPSLAMGVVEGLAQKTLSRTAVGFAADAAYCTAVGTHDVMPKVRRGYGR